MNKTFTYILYIQMYRFDLHLSHLSFVIISWNMGKEEK